MQCSVAGAQSYHGDNNERRNYTATQAFFVSLSAAEFTSPEDISVVVT
jgi:hypothetical protein